MNANPNPIEKTQTAAERDAWDLAEARRHEVEEQERRSVAFLDSVIRQRAERVAVALAWAA